MLSGSFENLYRKIVSIRFVHNRTGIVHTHKSQGLLDHKTSHCRSVRCRHGTCGLRDGITLDPVGFESSHLHGLEYGIGRRPRMGRTRRSEMVSPRIGVGRKTTLTAVSVGVGAILLIQTSCGHVRPDTAELATASTEPSTSCTEAEVSSGVDSIFAFIDPQEPGCVIGVVKNGELVFNRAYGLASLEWHAPITPSVVFDIASAAKQFTAAAVILLELDGVLSLNDDIRTWLPEMPNYGHTVTIRHLLNHTGGIRDYLDLLTMIGKPYTDLIDEEDGVKLLARQKALNFVPGTEYRYSNSGYLLAAAIVRRTSGKSLREFCEERIFGPLGMEHTSFWDDHEEVIPFRASAYSLQDKRYVVSHELNNEVMGDGNLYTTLEDLARWDRNFYNPEVGGSDLLERLQTRGVLADGDTLDYAAGLEIGEYRGLRTVRHGGSSGGFGSEFLRFPDERTTVICFCNRNDASPDFLAEEVAGLWLDDRFPAASAGRETVGEDSESAEETGNSGVAYEPTDEQLESWIGTFRRGKPPSYLRVEREGDQLLLQIFGMTLPLRLQSATSGSVEATGTTAELTESVSGRPAEISINNGRPRHRIDVPKQTAATLTEYTGTYFSSELGVDYQINSENGRLMLHIPAFEPVEMHMGSDDEFFFVDWIIEFKRDQDGHISGFSVDTRRVSGIEFHRSVST